MNCTVGNNIYHTYINYFVNNIYNSLSRNINSKINKYYNYYKKSKIFKNIKFYFNLLTFESNYCCDSGQNKYLYDGYNSYYFINIPLQIKFNNLKSRFINYNIINIPKINQSGDIILNGYLRLPILYLQLATNNISYIFNEKITRTYFIKIKNNIYLYIYLYDDFITVYINSYKIKNDLFSMYNNVSFKNKYINFSKIDNVIYVMNLKNNNIKYHIFDKTININNFVNNTMFMDILSIVNKFLNLNLKKKFIQSSNNLINKSTNSVLKTIFRQFTKSVTIFDIEKYCDKLLYKKKIFRSFNIVLFKEHLLVNPVIHYTDQLNVLSYLTNKFKINIFGYSNSSNDKFKVSTNLRKIQSDYIGFINIVNTPDGDTCGLISKLANNTILDKFKLKLINCNNEYFENFTKIDITSKNLYNMTSNNFINIKKNSTFKVKQIEVFKNNEFKLINFDKNKTNKNLNVFNTLSITELIIPFLFNNDPCRGLMGSKMHTQALPLIYNEHPYVMTKYNHMNGLLFNKCITSLCEGIIVSVNNYKIIVMDDKNRYLHYYLYPFNVLDYNSFVSYKPIVWVGEKINIGKILALPSDLKHSEFTLGVNNLLNYSFYNGYEHEDAIVINKNLIIEDILTSISFDVYEEYLSINKLDYVELTLRHLLEYNRYNRYLINEVGVSSNQDYMLFGDILSTKIRYELSLSKNKKFFKVFKLIFKENKKLIVYTKPLTIKRGGEGRLIKYEILGYSKFRQLDAMYPEINVSYLTLRFFIFKIDRINIGDKLCGRHGNKGVVSKIVDNIDLPYTFRGLCPYSITSPIGALARINLGQFLEGSCGYFGLNFNCRIKAPINLYNYHLYSNMYLKNIFNSLNVYNNSYINFSIEKYLRDFKTGYQLKNFNLMLMPYFLKLMHTSKSKFQYRTVGKYSSLTQQPVKGKRVNGSQKFGEMEVWALESHGSAYTIRELGYIKTNVKYFKKFEHKGYKGSETFKVLTLELKNVLININRVDNYSYFNQKIKYNY
ncbi:RNA polymerase Rpb2 domain 6 family protein (apicoplast) [Theileria parva strain Muguga]|uniref:DNA-directed RNA polymerase subunit beta n=1 Tax=Theileria parva TaxID=5875 RepID=RPOB_THEPA|nr:RecName: Full=DNA-directed RNA polymerase subunit beta; AltName: Full=PEP; AltName: Full=Plastid-encoded RNA polymerase subunit beta; Short=RNA polymerase subunit beta [Theileria parva]EAN30414.1 RNA polymerase Rpb2 domain 6 family protein [Theileria parva strain Muguga]|eukprot:XP_762697.1 DNA-directed RNA polymerase subunit beta (apicoplast) [Theileria parva strain Muguga]